MKKMVIASICVLFVIIAPICYAEDIEAIIENEDTTTNISNNTT